MYCTFILPICPMSPGEVQSDESDHDYESTDLLDTIKKMQEFVVY